MVLNVRMTEIKHLSLESWLSENQFFKTQRAERPGFTALSSTSHVKVLALDCQGAQLCKKRQKLLMVMIWSSDLKGRGTAIFTYLAFQESFFGEEKRRPWLSTSRNKLLINGLCQILYLQTACSAAFEKTPLSLIEMPQYMQKNK